MKCKNCGKEIDPSSKFCVYCGTLVEAKIPSVPSKKNTKLFLIVGAISMIFVCGCIGLFLLNQPKEQNYENEMKLEEKLAEIQEEEEQVKEEPKEDLIEEKQEPREEKVVIEQREEKATPPVSSEYVFEHSDRQILSIDEIQAKSDYDLCLGVNEIYARHGRCFISQKLQDHFNSTSWYHGLYQPLEFDESYGHLLTDIDQKNIALIKEELARRNMSACEMFSN